jgi:hypothetical protein
MVRVFFLFFIFIENSSFSASIKKILKSRSIIQINTDNDINFKKNKRVCFYDKKDIIAACGKVLIVNKNTASVKLDINSIKKIKSSYIPKIDDADSIQALKKEPLFILKGLWEGGLIPQVGYYHLFYIPKVTSAEDTSSAAAYEKAWSQESPAVGLLLSLGGEVAVPKWKIAAGFRYRSYSSKEISANYNDTEETKYVVTTAASSSFGLYLDYYFFQKYGFELGSGLDFDQNNLAFLAILKDSSGDFAEANIAEATSSLSVISLRFPVRYVKSWGFLGFIAGVNFIIPVYGEPVFSGKVTDDQQTNFLTVDPVKHLKASLNHKKNSFALESVLGLHISL